jgi:Tfp pilus assembly protein FimT
MIDVKDERGITLPEIFITTAIAASLLLLSAEGFGAAITRTHGRAVSVELGGILRSARHAAMMERRTVQVSVDANGGGVDVTGAEAFGLRRYEFGSKGVTVESISGGSTVTFYPSGRSASPTTILLANGRHERWRITVGMTGRVVVH